MAGNIIGIIGQRLIRTLCKHCKKPRVSEPVEELILGVDQSITLYDPVGCEKCNSAGYKGRLSVMEVLKVDEDLDDMIANRATTRELLKQALASGFKTMADDGIRRIIDGETTIEELSRVVDLTGRLK
jgi:general secretion pathway protein E/type IV pilus assembly protein PilB